MFAATVVRCRDCRRRYHCGCRRHPQTTERPLPPDTGPVIAPNSTRRGHAPAGDAHAVRAAVNASVRDARRDATTHDHAAGHADEAARPGDGASAEGRGRDRNAAGASVSLHRPRRQVDNSVRHGTKTQKGFGPGTSASLPSVKTGSLTSTPRRSLAGGATGLTQTSLGKAPGVSFADRYRLLVGMGRAPRCTTRARALRRRSRPSRRRNESPWRTAKSRRRLTFRQGSLSVAARSMLPRTRADLNGTAQRRCWEARSEDYVIQNAAGRGRPQLPCPACDVSRARRDLGRYVAHVYLRRAVRCSARSSTANGARKTFPLMTPSSLRARRTSTSSTSLKARRVSSRRPLQRI